MGSWRFGRFTAVSALGVAVQLGVVAALAEQHVSPPLATALAVAVTLLHNFVWHRRWTWQDRHPALWPSLWRFLAANGLISLWGNVGLSLLLVDCLGWPVTGANAVGIGTCGIINYALADGLVFQDSGARRRRRTDAPAARRRTMG